MARSRTPHLTEANAAMEQRSLLDLSQRATREYVPPCHAFGEMWPGPAVKPMRQMTLLELRAKALAKQRRRQRREHKRRECVKGGSVSKMKRD